jgi:hypothetical protein
LIRSLFGTGAMETMGLVGRASVRVTMVSSQSPPALKVGKAWANRGPPCRYFRGTGSQPTASLAWARYVSSSKNSSALRPRRVLLAPTRSRSAALLALVIRPPRSRNRTPVTAELNMEEKSEAIWPSSSEQ